MKHSLLDEYAPSNGLNNPLIVGKLKKHISSDETLLWAGTPSSKSNLKLSELIFFLVWFSILAIFSFFAYTVSIYFGIFIMLFSLLLTVIGIRARIKQRSILKTKVYGLTKDHIIIIHDKKAIKSTIKRLDSVSIEGEKNGLGTIAFSTEEIKDFFLKEIGVERIEDIPKDIATIKKATKLAQFSEIKFYNINNVKSVYDQIIALRDSK